MEIIKSYSDLQQSKKLAEILPLESADMHYSKDFDGSWFVDLAEYTSVKIPKYVGNVEEHLLPCWTLASLLGVLPKEIIYKGNIVSLEFHVWENSFEYVNNADYTLCVTECYDNPIDACYELVLKLHELNLLGL